MGGFLQAAIPVALALVAYQGGVTRISRFRSMIRADMELLNKLPADHPSRAALAGHIEVMVARLILRERRQAEPFTEEGVTFGVTAAIAGMFLLGAVMMAAEAAGIYTPEPGSQPPSDAWLRVAGPLLIGLVGAWFAVKAWRRGTQAHEAAEDARTAPAVEEALRIHPQPS